MRVHKILIPSNGAVASAYIAVSRKRLYCEKMESAILKIIQFAKPVKEAEIAWKQSGIVPRKHILENMLNST